MKTITTITFDLSNQEELKEYESIMAHKRLVRVIKDLIDRTEFILNNPNDKRNEWAKFVNEKLINELSNKNIDINKL